MADFALVLVTIVWGTTFLLVQDALADIAPMRFLALRFALSAAVLLPLAWLDARRRAARAGAAGATGVTARDTRGVRDATLWRDAAGLGAALFVGYSTQTLGLLWTTSSTSAFLTGLSVVLVPVIGLALMREHLSAWTWAGVMSAVAGLGFLTLRGGIALGRGEAITLGTALAFAFHIRLTARAAPLSSPIALTAAQLAIAAALGFAALPLDAWLVSRGAGSAAVVGLFSPLSVRVWMALLVCGLLGSGAAFVIQSWAQRRLPPTRVGVLFALEPVFAALVAAGWGGERFGIRGFAGMALILAGILAVETLGREPEGAVAH